MLLVEARIFECRDEELDRAVGRSRLRVKIAAALSGRSRAFKLAEVTFPRMRPPKPAFPRARAVHANGLTSLCLKFGDCKNTFEALPRTEPGAQRDTSVEQTLSGIADN